MKIVTHPAPAKKDVPELRAKHAMHIQFSRMKRLTIERGDTIKQVGTALADAYPITVKHALALATLYFNVGERLASKTRSAAPWAKTELVVRPARKFLTK